MDNVVGRTKHGELTLDEIAGMMPGMAEVMLTLAHRYHVMYYAAKVGNWQLAAYQLGGARKALRTAKLTRPKYTQAIDQFLKEFLEPIDVAIRERQWTVFEQLMRASVEASDGYHREWGYPYIRYRIPAAPPQGYSLERPEGGDNGELPGSGG